MANIQSNINQLLGVAAGLSKGKQLLDANKADNAYKAEMQRIEKATAQQKLTRQKLLNKQLRMKNKAIKNMQNEGNTKVKTKNDFNAYKESLKGTQTSIGDFNSLDPTLQNKIAEQLYKEKK